MHQVFSNIGLRYLKRSEIDTILWDACISTSPQGLIYAYSFYLDNMAENWDALVLNDYEVVMPLPWKRKWGVRYVYQLPFVQRLGIYGCLLDDKIIKLFYEKATKYIKFFNYKVDLIVINSAKVKTYKNFFINLSDSYCIIKNGYSQECLKNVYKAKKRGCVLQSCISAELVVNFFKQAYGNYYTNYNKEIYKKLELLIEDGCRTGLCKNYAVLDQHKKPVFAAALFQDNKRIYYCVGAPTEEGRKLRATYFFIDEILKQNASQNLMFDFEGSEISNVAAFYKKFGPKEEYYSEIHINLLPFPFRWLKNKKPGY